MKPGTRAQRLAELAESEGCATLDELLAAAASDSVSPGICIVCGYTTEVEPDQDRGWCENCGKGTVKSALVLFGVI
jgi:hypothetical protein